MRKTLLNPNNDWDIISFLRNIPIHLNCNFLILFFGQNHSCATVDELRRPVLATGGDQVQEVAGGRRGAQPVNHPRQRGRAPSSPRARTGLPRSSTASIVTSPDVTDVTQKQENEYHRKIGSIMTGFVETTPGCFFPIFYHYSGYDQDAGRAGTFPFNDQSMTIQIFWLFYWPKCLWPVKEMIQNFEKRYEFLQISN